VVFIAGKLCDPCLSALKWFVYHARRYTSARLFQLKDVSVYCEVSVGTRCRGCEWRMRIEVCNVILEWNSEHCDLMSRKGEGG